jgi:hypothetical protein
MFTLPCRNMPYFARPVERPGTNIKFEYGTKVLPDRTPQGEVPHEYGQWLNGE